jgi:hypothetical protein
MEERLRKLLTDHLSVKMDISANFYSCTLGQFSHNNWTCDGSATSPYNCNSPTFCFDPDKLFVPQIQAVTGASTVTVISLATGTTSVTSSATGAASALPNMVSCPSHNSTLAGLGVGLGVAFLLSAIAALSIFLVERKKHKAAEKIAAQAQASR